MSKIWNEFKEFISRGNVMDMAVGIIIGAAFTAIVNSLVSDIVMPIIALATGGLNFESWVIPLGGDNHIAIGSFINAIISFFLIALVVFAMVKVMNTLRRKKEVAPTTKTCPYCKSTDLAIDAIRCPHCGSDLTADPTPAKAAKSAG